MTEETEENYKNVSTAGNPTKIQTQYLTNTRLKCYCYTNMLSRSC